METTYGIIPKERIRQRFTQALESYEEQAVAQRHICRRLAGYLRNAGHTAYKRILEIGCGTGAFTGELATLAGGRGAEWVINDLCPDCREPVSVRLQGENWTYLPGDAETLAFTGTFDLVASASVIQWFGQPDAFIARMAGALRPGGVLLLNTFGKENLREIKALTGNGLPYPAVSEVGVWAERAGLETVRLEEETLSLRFPSPAEVLRHLKRTGVTGTGSGRFTRGRLERFCREYAARYACGSEVVLTYQPVYLLAVKK